GDLAGEGGRVAFRGGLPTDVAGLGELEKRRGELREVLKGIDTQAAKFGAGKILTGDDVDAVLRAANVAREPFEAGIRFVRRTHAPGDHYFLLNPRGKPVDDWVFLRPPARAAP